MKQINEVEISAETVEVACEAFYNDPGGLCVWAKMAPNVPVMADRYRASMIRALEAAARTC